MRGQKTSYIVVKRLCCQVKKITEHEIYYSEVCFEYNLL
jgi:hypothetical protein